MRSKIQAPRKAETYWKGSTCQIRDFRRSDAANFYAFASLPVVPRYMSWEPHTSVAESRSYLEGVCRKRGRTQTPLALTLKDSDKCCGFISFTNYEAEHRRADFAIALAPFAHGRGIAQEACRYLLQRAETMGLVRLQGIVEEGNEASRKLMKRLGATEEGLLRRYLQAKSGLVNAYMYAFYLGLDRT